MSPEFTPERKGKILVDYPAEHRSDLAKSGGDYPTPEVREPLKVEQPPVAPRTPASQGRPQSSDKVNPYAPYGFAVRRGKTTGKTNIYGGRLFITVARDNGNGGYDSEEPVPYLPDNMTETADYETTELDLSGTLWLSWGDVSDGVPGYVEIRSSASGEFNVQIATIGDPIIQHVHGDVHWTWFDNGSSSGGSSGTNTSDGSSGIPSSGIPSSGIGSSKDTAIVPGPNGTYVKWHAMESAEVLFFDFHEFKVGHGTTRIGIDPVVLFGIERETARTFGSPDVGNAHVTVEGEEIVIRSRFPKRIERQTVQVMLKATRRGFAGVRNGHATYDDMVDNECRLNPRMTRKQVIEALAHQGITQ